MSHKNRGGKSGRSRPSFNADPTVRIGDCRDCDKQIYLSRGVARINAKRYPADSRPRPYRCPHNDEHWHIGHVPAAVRNGDITRADWDRWRRGKAS